MKAILMSIKPKWCEKIFSREKTIEVRKTAPKETPFKVLVYCTKERMTRVPSMYAYLHKNEPRACAEYGTIETWGEIGDVIVNPHLASKHVSFGMHGKVIGEFVCDKVRDYIPFGLRGYELPSEWLKNMCLSKEQLDQYGGLKTLHGLHITEPKIYDTPKELSEFRKPCPHEAMPCWICPSCDLDKDYYNLMQCLNTISRPPQSWCYVEEAQGD